MYIHTNIHNSICKFKHAFIKDYKKLLTYIWCRDNIGLCNLIDEWTDESYNVYQKFILMLYVYKTCINDKLVYNSDSSKYIYYIDDIIEKLPEINVDKWFDITDNISILIQLPTKFYSKYISEDTNITISEMNDYFINNCITSIKVGDEIHSATNDIINMLPSNIFNQITDYIRDIDYKLQQINIFNGLNLQLSLFTILSIIRFIYNIDRTHFIEFEYAMRRHVKMTNFDDISYLYAHDIADIYSHELQEQKDAIENANHQMQ